MDKNNHFLLIHIIPIEVKHCKRNCFRLELPSICEFNFFLEWISGWQETSSRGGCRWRSGWQKWIGKAVYKSYLFFSRDRPKPKFQPKPKNLNFGRYRNRKFPITSFQDLYHKYLYFNDQKVRWILFSFGVYFTVWILF